MNPGLLIVVDCENNNNFAFTSIARTDVRGNIIEDDLDDWQPRTLSPDYPLSASPAYPNPAGKDSVGNFFPEESLVLACVIRYAISRDSYVKVTINDRPDRIVSTLVDAMCCAGFYQILWDLKNDSGEPVPNEIYRVFINAKTEDITYQTYGDIQIQR